MRLEYINECAADGCYKKSSGAGKQMCDMHHEMYEQGKPFKAFHGKTVQKKKFQLKANS